LVASAQFWSGFQDIPFVRQYIVSEANSSTNRAGVSQTDNGRFESDGKRRLKFVNGGSLFVISDDIDKQAGQVCDTCELEGITTLGFMLQES